MGVLLGIDYGEKRIGLALSDSGKTLARRFLTVDNSRQKGLETIMQIIITENIEGVVVGVPVGLKGESEQTKLVQRFIEQLQKNITVPVFVINEVMTSKMATTNLQQLHKNHARQYKKQCLDQEAARIILQDYLDNNVLIS